MKSTGCLAAVSGVALLCLTLSTVTSAQNRPRFRGMDSNRDGVVSRAEWRGNDQSFREQDRDGDGVLSRDEVREGSGAVPDFRFLDMNGNGQVTAQEWMRAFNDLDRDRDGVLREDEVSLEETSSQSLQDNPAYQAGFERGINDGRIAGREDRELRGAWDLEGQRELEQADAGYRVDLGARPDYQAGYRLGFRQGYTEGFGPRR